MAGFALRLRPVPVVVVAAFATALAAGMPLIPAPGREGLLDLLGRAFAEFRLMTLFLLTLPAIGLAERYGLGDRSAELIQLVRSATVGRLLLAYQAFRVLHGILGIRLNGHPVFVRPLVFPMARAAAGASHEEEVKSAVSAAENYGNFYGQNLAPAQAGVLLVFGVLTGLGLDAGVWQLVQWALPVAAISLLFGMAQFRHFERRLRSRGRRP